MNYQDEKNKLYEQFGEKPKNIIKYFGYRDGKCLGTFHSETEARTNGAIAVEKCFENYDDILKWQNDWNKALGELNDKWHAWLRKEYGHLNDGVYGIVYTMAYERGHSAGYDEVASYMSDFSDFAEKIIKESKIGK